VKLADQIDNWQDGLDDTATLAKRLDKAEWAIQISEPDSEPVIAALRGRLEGMIANHVADRS